MKRRWCSGIMQDSHSATRARFPGGALSTRSKFSQQEESMRVANATLMTSNEIFEQYLVLASRVYCCFVSGGD